MSDLILASAAEIANTWRLLAVAWHLVVAAVVVASMVRRVEAQSIAGVLASMLFSVAALAWWAGNPFNALVFVAASVSTVLLAATSIASSLQRSRSTELAAGAMLCAFGWSYPHFLTGPGWQYLYAAPLGLLPCPTLAFILGVSLLTNNLGSTRWGVAFGALGLFYGVVGVFVLDVTIDWLLIAGAALVLARVAVSLRLLEVAAFHREKRHV